MLYRILEDPTFWISIGKITGSSNPIGKGVSL